MLCDTADPLSLTFDLGNDCASCSQDVHRVESLVFSNHAFKHAKQVCQTFLHQRLKVFQIVCKRRGDTRVGQSKRQHASVTFANNDSHSDLQIGLRQMYFWNSLWFQPWHRWFAAVSTWTVVPPRTGEVSCGGARVTELVVAPRLSGNLLCFLLSHADRARRKWSAQDSSAFLARPREVPVRNARITTGSLSVRSRGTTSEYCWYS